MFKSLNAGRGARWIAVCFVVLFAAACAQNKPDGLSSNVKPGTGQDFVVNVGDRVFFEEDQSVVTSQGQATLANQAKWLNRYPQYTITIEGHADERGTREYNLALGARRANSAREFLVSRGIQGHRIKTVSFGKERPVELCSKESCYSENRRAVSVVSNLNF